MLVGMTFQAGAEIAEQLATAERTRTPIEPVSAEHPGFDVRAAYDVQLINVKRRLGEGEQVRGHKIGLTSRAMQEQLGVDEPDYGRLFDTMFVEEGGEIAANDLCAPRIEMEVAFVLGRQLTGPGCTPVDIIRATEFVAPALEIIDSRIADWRITLADTIADNASSARVVVGGSPTALDEIDVRLLGAVMRQNGEVVATGSTAAVLGNPVNAVTWLVNKLGEAGERLCEGSVLLSGSCTQATAVTNGDTVRADFDELGHVAVNFV